MRPTTRATATTLEKCRIAVIHLGIIAENGWISDFFSDDNVWYISRVLSHVTLTVSQADCPIQVPGENELLLSDFCAQSATQVSEVLGVFWYWRSHFGTS
jgi:hypothetical protein